MSHNQPTGKRDRSDRSAARQGLRARHVGWVSPGGKRQSPRDGGVAASGRLVRGGQTRPALITARVHPGMVHQSQKSRNPINPDKGLAKSPGLSPKSAPKYPAMLKGFQSSTAHEHQNVHHSSQLDLQCPNRQPLSGFRHSRLIMSVRYTVVGRVRKAHGEHWLE
ncbi:hypothetical protein J6590_099164 [Homalodisca vitripennis]|nr:hypothetical protein J6590_099164 [Homalodisca vitripennis]